MQTTTALSTLALALGGGALALTLLRAPSAPAATGAAAGAVAPGVDVAAELDALRAEAEALRARLAVIEAQPVMPQRVPALSDDVSRAEFDAFRDQVLAALEGAVSGALPGALAGQVPETFTAQVAQSLDQIRQEERERKARTQLEDRRESIDAQLPKLTERLELTPAQTQSMRDALYAQVDRDAELLRLWEGGADPEFLGEQKVANNQARRADLEAFLTPQQLERHVSRGGGKR